MRAILDAARVAAADPDGPTMSRIGELSGVAPGSIYRFFKSKDHLYVELALTLLDEIRAEVDAALDELDADDVAAGTRALVGWMCDRFERDRRLLGVLQDALSRLDVDERVERAQVRIVDVVARALAHRLGLPLVTAECRAYVIVRTCCGVLMADRSDARVRVPLEALRDELELLLGGYVRAA